MKDFKETGFSRQFLKPISLFKSFQRLRDEGVKYRLTISFSPTLACMLTDELLQSRYIRHIERMIELAEKEVERTKDDPEMAPLARMYRGLYKENPRLYSNISQKYSAGFKMLEKEGYIDIITTAATHSFLPCSLSTPGT